MPLLGVGDIALNYVDRPARAGIASGPDVLLMHGFGVTSQVWEPLIPFIDLGRRVVAFDARGHGKSSSNGSFTLDNNVFDAIAVIERLGLDRPVVVGSSIGAVYATEVVSRAPHLVSGAVFAGGVGHSFATIPGFVDANLAMVNGLRTDLQRTVASAVPSWFGPLSGPRMHAWVAAQFANLRVEASAIVVELLNWDPRPLLPTIELPLHYVHGRYDGIPVSIAQECANLSPHARVTVAEHAGHMPHIELPGWFGDFV